MEELKVSAKGTEESGSDALSLIGLLSMELLGSREKPSKNAGRERNLGKEVIHIRLLFDDIHEFFCFWLLSSKVGNLNNANF